MIVHGSTYKLARQFQTLSDSEVQLLPKNLQLELLRNKTKENLHAAKEQKCIIHERKKFDSFPDKKSSEKTLFKATFPEI